MIELLAPAKDKICAKAAIDFGADAIYIGASEFGARKNVPNSLSDMKEIVEYARQFNVKVYVALNTILTDEELVRAKGLIKELKEIGVDAIIIQDMGLLKEGKKARGQEGEGNLDLLPLREKVAESRMRGIEYHASTQCDNRTVEKVQFLESVGFSRVILARELSIEQIKEIKENTNVELEAFIHGALCVSYSGQCYMSQMIGGRSSNRGECAQPCRKKYSLIDENGNYIAKDKHLLCLKDFNASKHLKELADAGVTSFKIEGRLKDESYVKNVVGYYRKLIDDFGFDKTSSGRILFDFEPNLEKSFNRGFTDYFLDGKRKQIFNFDSPKSLGECIGKVSKVGQSYFEIATLTPDPTSQSEDIQSSDFGRVLKGEGRIAPQDGLCFYDDEKLSGCLVNKVESRSSIPARQQIFPNRMDGIKVGTDIYRNVDVGFEKALKNSKTCRKIGVNIEFELGKIKAIDEDNNLVQINYEFEELAQNAEKMRENIITQLKKSGDTIFMVDDVKIKTDKIPFLPVSKVNELRRELLDNLINKRFICHCEEGQSPDAAIQEKNFGLLHCVRNNIKIDYRWNILNKSAKEFYEKLGFEVTEMALESGKTSKTGKVAMTCKHCLKYAFNMCTKNNKIASVGVNDSTIASANKIASVENSCSTSNLKSRNDADCGCINLETHLPPCNDAALFLIDEKGKKYPLEFDCKKCEMSIIF